MHLAKSLLDSPSNTTLNEHSSLFPLTSLAVYTIRVVLLKMCGGLIPGGTTVTCGARSLLSRATGLVQFTNTVEFALMLARISAGQLMNTGGTTSAIIYQLYKSTLWYTKLDVIIIVRPFNKRNQLSHKNAWSLVSLRPHLSFSTKINSKTLQICVTFVPINKYSWSQEPAAFFPGILFY